MYVNVLNKQQKNYTLFLLEVVCFEKHFTDILNDKIFKCKI